MAQEIALDITINSLEASQSLSELKKSIKDATNALASFEEGSDEFNKLSGAIGKAKDNVQDLNEAVALSSQGGFGAIADIGSKIAAGFSVAQSAMALFGSESKELEETLMKVQAAMALAQGAKELSELGKSFNNLKQVAGAALKSIKAEIIGTGIGALVVALGLVVAYWDDIKEAVTGVSEEQKKVNSTTRVLVAASEKILENYESQENTLRLQGKTDEEILQGKIKIQKEVIKTNIAQLESLKATKKAEEDANKKKVDALMFFSRLEYTLAEKTIEILFKPLDLLIERINETSRILGKGDLIKVSSQDAKNVLSQYNQVLETIGKSTVDFLFSNSEELDKQIEDQEKKIKKLVSDEQGNELQLKKIREDKSKSNKEKRQKDSKDEENDKKISLQTIADLDEQDRLEAIKRLENKRKDWELSGRLTYERQKEILKDIYELEILNQKLTDEEKKALKLKLDEDLKKIDEQRTIDQTNKYKKEREEIQKDYDKRIAQQEKFLDEQKRKKRNTDDEELILAKLQYDKILAITNEGDEARINARKQYDAKVAEIDERERQRKERNVQFGIDSTVQGLQTLQSLVTAFAGKSEAQQKRAFEINKAAQIAETIISTISGAQKAYTSQLLPGDPTGPIRGAIAAALTIAGGIARVRQIEQTKFESKSSSSMSSGGGGGGGEFAPNLNAPVGNTSTNLSSIGFGGQESEPVKVFVTETDISSTQNKVQKIEQKASIE